MITHLIRSINWIDVALGVLFARAVFIGVTSGFVSEFFRVLGVLVATFISLHFYSSLAALVADKTHFVWEYTELIIFIVLWLAVVLLFKSLKEGIVLLFKIEAIHKDFDKYAGGVLAIARGIFLCSLTIYALLLLHNASLTRTTLRSYSFKIAGRASVNTYTYLYKNLVEKLFVGEHYNTAVIQVLHPAA